MGYQTIDVRPIAGALGAELTGVDLSQDLDDQTLSDIHQAFLDHLVIFFRDQHITPDRHKALGRRFGTLNIHPYVQGMEGHPEIVEVIREPGEAYNWGGSWHTDVTFLEKPALGSILYARAVPPHAGDTIWANMYLAYDALSDGMKAMLGSLRAVHNSGVPGRFSERYESMNLKEDEGAIESVHPVVRTHPETGRKLLFVNAGFTKRFEDMTVAESRPLLDFLFRHQQRPEFSCRFRWRENSIAFWDNRATHHLAIADFHDGTNGRADVRRVMHRVTIDGDRPV
jgi:taurine dioxygenase